MDMINYKYYQQQSAKHFNYCSITVWQCKYISLIYWSQLYLFLLDQAVSLCIFDPRFVIAAFWTTGISLKMYNWCMLVMSAYAFLRICASLLPIDTYYISIISSFYSITLLRKAVMANQSEV